MPKYENTPLPSEDKRSDVAPASGRRRIVKPELSPKERAYIDEHGSAAEIGTRETEISKRKHDKRKDGEYEARHRQAFPGEESLEQRRDRLQREEEDELERTNISPEERSNRTREWMQNAQRAEGKMPNERTREWMRAKQQEEMDHRLQLLEYLRDPSGAAEYDVDLSSLGGKESKADIAMKKARLLEGVRQVLPHADQIWDLVNRQIEDRGGSLVSAMDYVNNLAIYRESLKPTEDALSQAGNSHLKATALERLFNYNRLFGIDQNNALIQSVLASEDVGYGAEKERGLDAQRAIGDLRKATETFLASQRSGIKDEEQRALETWLTTLRQIREADEFAGDIKERLFEVAAERLKTQEPKMRQTLNSEIQLLAAQFLREQETVAASQAAIRNLFKETEQALKGMTVAKAQKLLKHPDILWQAAQDRLKGLGHEAMRGITNAEHNPATQLVYAVAAYNDAVNRLDNKSVAQYRQIVADIGRALGFEREGQALINSEMKSYDETLTYKNPFG